MSGRIQLLEMCCPNCGKELVNLNIGADVEDFEIATFWCDDCNIEINITDCNITDLEILEEE